MRFFLIALQFLTVIPVKIKGELRKEDFGLSLFYFPLVGVFIGVILAGSVFLFDFLPRMVMAAVILIISVIITGGMHLDGFADTCDGFYGNRSKEKILEVMRDSRIGVMGVVGIVSLLLLKFSLIVGISQSILWRSLIMMAAFGRWSQSAACYASGYARSEGKAKYFIEYVGRREILGGGLFTLMVFGLLMQIKGLILFFVSLVPVFLLVRYINRKIGGMTGDTVGAVNEVSEATILFICLILQVI